MWLHSLKVAQLLRSAVCLHANQSRSYLNHLVKIKLWRNLVELLVYVRFVKRDVGIIHYKIHYSIEIATEKSDAQQFISLWGNVSSLRDLKLPLRCT